MNYLLQLDCKTSDVNVIYNTYDQKNIEIKLNTLLNNYTSIEKEDNLYYKEPGLYYLKIEKSNTINIYEKYYSYIPLSNPYKLISTYYIREIQKIPLKIDTKLKKEDENKN